jgi:pimeloyl-ACP methyl ester carboxylesterase
VPGIVLGPVLGLLGFGACSPWLLDRLSRKAAPLPLTLRLAVRDSGRFRERNGAVVTAVLAGMSMSVTVAVLVFSLERAVDAFPAPLRDDQLRVEGPGADETARRIADALAAVAVAPLHAAYVHGEPLRARFDGRPSPRRGEWVAVGGDDLARALGLDDRDASPSRGALFALDPPEDGGPVQLTAWLDGAAVAGPAVKPVRTSRTVREPAFLLDADAAEHMGLTSGPPPSDGLVPWLVRLDAPVTVAQLERARSLAAESVRTSVDAALLRGSPFRPLYRAVLLVCGLTGLLVVVIATALSAAESAADERVLHTVGAAPRVLRSHLAARAGYLAWLGCVLAVPAGILAALALFEAANFPLPFVLPWRAMATVVLGLPGLVFVCTWCVGSPRGRGAGLAAPLTTLALLVGVPASAAADPRAVVPPTVRWEPFTAVAFDGSPLPGERGFLELPEERSRPGEGTITLAFARYRSANPDPGPPIFFLAGGPGGPGIEGAATVATHPQLRLLEHADVIGIDQRGSGASRPSLASEELVETLPADRPLDRAALVAALRRAVARTVDHWKRQGVDLHAFDTEESADDLDAVRAALGLDSIVLYGASYGSHLGLAYLRRHGEHVARALLSRVEGPGDTWKLPATVQRQLERVDRLAAGDPRRGPDDPGLVERLALLLDRLDAAPVVVPGDPGTHDEPAVAVSALDLRISVARALDSVDTIAALPAWLARLERGDWNALAADAREHRRAGVHAMALMMDCASGAGAERRAALERQRRDERNLLGDAILAPFYLEACEAAGSPDLGDGFRAPFASDVPVLFVSGTLDVRTPPENVERLRHGFSTQAHVVVENAGHPPRELMSRDYRDLLQAFLRGEPVEDCRIALPEPVFESPE